MRQRTDAILPLGYSALAIHARRIVQGGRLRVEQGHSSPLCNRKNEKKMQRTHEIDMEIFSEKLDFLLSKYVVDGMISIEIADTLHAQIIDFFQNRS